MIEKIFHYSHALEVRLFQLHELSLLRHDGVEFSPGFQRKIWKCPSKTEDWVNLARFLRPSEGICLLDIGANVGDFTADFLECLKGSRSVCFEPMSATYKQLTTRFQADPRVETHHCAISSYDGNAEMHIERDSTLCSLVEYTDVANAAYQTETAQLEKIECKRLDSFPYRKGAERLLVKIDVQGFEIEVIRGAAQTLASADAILLECSFAEEYKGKEPSFSLACSLLRELGHYPIVFQDYGRSISTYAFERDVLFVKRELLSRVWKSHPA